MPYNRYTNDCFTSIFQEHPHGKDIRSIGQNRPCRIFSIFRGKVPEKPSKNLCGSLRFLCGSLRPRFFEKIHPVLKKSAEEIFRDLGLTTSQAIPLFYRQVEINEGLPFAVKLRQIGNARSPRGKYASVQTSSEAFARRKYEEIALER